MSLRLRTVQPVQEIPFEIEGPEGDDGAGEGAGAGTGGSGAGGTPVTGQGAAQPGTQSAGTPQAPTFTPEQQQYLDRLVGTARTEGRESGRRARETELLNAHNFSDLDAMNAAINRGRQQQEGEQQAIPAIKTLQDQIAQLQTQLNAKNAQELVAKRSSGIEAAAKSLQAHDPADIAEWAAKNAKDEFEALVDPTTGAVDEAKAKAIVEKAKAAKPHWFKKQGGGTLSMQDGEVTPPDKAAQDAAARQMAMEVRNRW
jgi:hypothetical protein